VTRLRYRENDGERPDGVPAGSVVTVLRVPPEAAGMRLDVFVKSQLKRTSRTRAQAIVRRSAFGPDGRRLFANDRVFAEQRVLLWREPWDEAKVSTDLPVLYEDEHLFAIAKPAGVAVHPTARYHQSTVVKLLSRVRPGETFTLAHRLDRETSGVLLLAKTREADRGIKKQLQERVTVEKRYWALTWGAPDVDELRVDFPLEIDSASPLRVRMRVAASGGLAAATRFRVLERVQSRGRWYGLLQCELETGRQHQIRVHLAAIGCPVVGDKLYGPDPEIFARGADDKLTSDDRARLELGRHALHAARLAFDHPVTGNRVVVEAPMASDMVEFWRAVSDIDRKPEAAADLAIRKEERPPSSTEVDLKCASRC
jgi:23S rRNA pseudouridine1911/1915/1917 synthase